MKTIKKNILFAFGLASLTVIVSSCFPPPPPGRVLLAAPARMGFYAYGRHGHRFFIARPWVRPRMGAYVEYLPEGYTTVIISRVPYFYYEGDYYRPNGPGYVVVAPQSSAPQAAEQPSSQSETPAASTQPDTVTVNVPNSKGSFTPVKLIKHDGGYIGPQGEFYSGHPTMDQLKALYGN